MTRRGLLLAAAAQLPRKIALTMDDFHWRFLGTDEDTVLANNRSLLQLLERERLQAAAFFIGSNADSLMARPDISSRIIRGRIRITTLKRQPTRSSPLTSPRRMRCSRRRRASCRCCAFRR